MSDEKVKIFTKIAHVQNETKINWGIPEHKDKNELTSKQPPVKDFFDALQAFGVVVGLMPVNQDKYLAFVVKSVNMKHGSAGVEQVIVGGTFTFEDDERPSWNVVTHKISLSDIDGGQGMVDKLIAEAQLFIDGQRSQLSMEFENGEDGEGVEDQVPSVEVKEEEAAF